MLNDVGAALAVIESRIARPFEWGSDANDCVSFAAAVIRAHTGVDPIADLLWHDEASARSLIERLGGFEASINSRMTRIAPAMAQRFDAAMVLMPSGPLLTIVEGDMLVGPGSERQMRLPRTRAAVAWTMRGRL